MMRKRLYISILASISCAGVAWACIGAKANEIQINKSSGQTQKSSCFLVISDTHLNPFIDSPSRFGGDTRMDLWTLATAEINKVLNTQDPKILKPRFTLFLGDMPLHSDDSTKRSMAMSLVLKFLRESSMSSHVPLFYVPGNNDPVQDDYAPFTIATSDLDTGIKSTPYHWPVIESDPARQCFDQGSYSGKGWYAAYPLGKDHRLKLVVMNTIPFSKRGSKADLQHQMMGEELKWLSEELDADAKEGDSIIIAMHIPPSEWAANIPYEGSTVLNTFLGLMKKRSQNILSVIGAHTHYDGVSRLFYELQNPVSPGYSPYTLYISAPSISPDHGNNPAVKLIFYDSTKYTLTDFYTMYYTGLGNSTGSWNGEYHFKTSFHCEDAESIHAGMDMITQRSEDSLKSFLYAIQRVQAGPVILKYAPKLNIYPEQ